MMKKKQPAEMSGDRTKEKKKNEISMSMPMPMPTCLLTESMLVLTGKQILPLRLRYDSVVPMGD